MVSHKELVPGQVVLVKLWRNVGVDKTKVKKVTAKTVVTQESDYLSEWIHQRSGGQPIFLYNAEVYEKIMELRYEMTEIQKKINQEVAKLEQVTYDAASMS